MDPRILSLLLEEKWAISSNLINAYYRHALRAISGQKFHFEGATEPKLEVFAWTPGGGAEPVEDTEQLQDTPENSVAVINMRETLLKYGDLCSFGTEDLAQWIKAAYQADHIRSIALRTHSPGGTTSSVIPLTQVLNSDKKKKPVIGIVDNQAASAAYYPLVMTDRIVAVDPMASVGSIGTMAIVVKDKQKMENEGYEVLRIYPDESSYKNKPHEQVLEEGQTELYKEELLKPWAIHFQNHVKQYRGNKLNLKAEGLLEGRMYYAEEAKENGLIDDIMDYEQALEYAYNLGQKDSIIKSIQ